MAFADGLDRWELAGSFLAGGQSHGQDYSCAVAASPAGRSAVLAAAVPEPEGFAVLVQTIYADDYRGRTVTFRAELRTTDITGHAGLVLRIEGHISEGHAAPQRPAGQDPLRDPGNHFAFVAGTCGWTRREVTAQVPPGATNIIFGVFLNGPGQIELRRPQLEPADQPPSGSG
jgi:hypothetical protein